MDRLRNYGVRPEISASSPTNVAADYALYTARGREVAKRDGQSNYQLPEDQLSPLVSSNVRPGLDGSFSLENRARFTLPVAERRPEY